MVWVLVVVAFVVLGLGAWVGTGRFGEMPEVVNDRPKGRIPQGPVDEQFLETVAFPLASTGYDPAQVDAFLADHAAGRSTPVGETTFDTVRNGYDMQAVDEVLARLPEPAGPDVAPESPDSPDDKPLQPTLDEA